MKAVVIGAHLRRDDIEPVATALPVADLFLSTSPVETQQPIGDRKLLLRIAEMRGQLLERATFVAVRYGFTVTSGGDAAERCAPHIARWRELLEQHRDHVEMTLKVAVNAAARPDRHDFPSGAAYLRALHDVAQSGHVDPAFEAAVQRLLLPLAIEHRWLHRDPGAVELVALVARERLDAFRVAGNALKADCPATPFLLSGPWPLEVFADADHE